MANRSLVVAFATAFNFMSLAGTALAAEDSERTPLKLDESTETAASSGGGGGSIVRTIVGLRALIERRLAATERTLATR